MQLKAQRKVSSSDMPSTTTTITPTVTTSDVFRCPISAVEMTDPVIDPTSGTSADRSSLEQWIRQHGTSPWSRQPLAIAQLVPNRALKEAIEQQQQSLSVAVTVVPASPTLTTTEVSVPATTTATTIPADVLKQLGVECVVRPAADGTNDKLVYCKVMPADSTTRTPIDLACVIDVSGSMGSEATSRDPTTDAQESHGLSVLDIVKHALKTIIGIMSDQDSLSIIAFSTSSRCVLSRRVMNEAGRRAADKAVDDLEHGGQTNLWDGMRAGLATLTPDDASATSVGNGTPTGNHAGRRSSMLVLTDGMPNISPPRGTIPMLNRFLDGMGTARGAMAIHTFGFGYQLDSKLLQEIAHLGDGAFTFIPEAGFVGTAFVNAVSNLLTVVSTDLSFEITHKAGQRLTPMGYNRVVRTPTKTTIHMGSLRCGQQRDAVVRVVNDPAAAAAAAGGIETTEFVPENEMMVRVGLTKVDGTACFGEPVYPQSEIGDTSGDTSAIDVDFAKALFRLRLVDELKQTATENRASVAAQKVWSHGMWCTAVDAIIKDLKASPATVGDDAAMVGLLGDMEGQVSEALSQDDWYQRWGRHYLGSLMFAHQLQQCNNFKDPGVQGYGGSLFAAVRDHADDVFCKLPAPTPSRRVQAATASGYGASYGGGAARSPSPIDYASRYYNSNISCFHGGCDVRMANGISKRVDAVKQGDIVATPDGKGAVVDCVLRTVCPTGHAPLVRLPGGLIATEWHPVHLPAASNAASNAASTASNAASNASNPPNKEWVFPGTIAPMTIMECDAVFSFLVQGQPIMLINEVEASCLAHDLTDNDVISHEFWGTQRVAQAMKRIPGFEGGVVTITPDAIVRDATTGRVCDIRVE